MSLRRPDFSSLLDSFAVAAFRFLSAARTVPAAGRSWSASVPAALGGLKNEAAFLLPVFASALFVSAFLLFGVQPMFAKMVLPVLGGSPSVWSVAMCFFQFVLLLGYAWSHFLITRFSTRHGALIHIGVLAIALLTLPLGLAEGWGEPPQTGVYLWVFGLFAVSIGLPFFALSGNGPLLQAWFARTGHPHANDPYFLYGASNLGSLLALLAYPFFIEPAIGVQAQANAWTGLFALLIGLLGLSAFLVRGKSSAGPVQSKPGAGQVMAAIDPAPASEPRTGLHDRLVWAGLAFVPSGLLVSVTYHLTTDVAAAPFMWVFPLALFLLTFVITFQRQPLLKHRHMLAIQPFAGTLVVFSLFAPVTSYLLVDVGIHMMAFFVSAMVCHGALVRRRPDASRLTEFYLWMAIGGMLGGLFPGLIAPQIFNTVAEYPIMLFVALLARPGVWPALRDRVGVEAAIVLAILAAVALIKLAAGFPLTGELPLLYKKAFLAVIIFAILVSRRDALRLASLTAALLLTGNLLLMDSAGGNSFRGFFGVNRVVDTPDKTFRQLIHGRTYHGVERIDAAALKRARPEPLMYYHAQSPFADTIKALRAEGRLGSVAAVGLGTGSLACYAQSGETWRFFEIDPLVARIAKDSSKFTFLSKCTPQAPIIIGDARLTLAREKDGRYGLIILDAFSSDNIPVHLLTVEAVRIYLSKLAADGVLLVHISNRHLDMAPALSALAREFGLAGLVKLGTADPSSYKTSARVVVLARKPRHLARVKAIKGWRPLPETQTRVWTDDYADILGAIISYWRSGKD